MKDKNLPDDIISKSLNELTELANNIIKKLEQEQNLEKSKPFHPNPVLILFKITNELKSLMRQSFKEPFKPHLFKLKGKHPFLIKIIA